MNAMAPDLFAAPLGIDRLSTNKCAPSLGRMYANLWFSFQHSAASPLQTTPMSTLPASRSLLGLSESYFLTSFIQPARIGRARARFSFDMSFGPTPIVASAQLTISRLSLTTMIRPAYLG